jgi:hypothetical protein
LKVDTRRPNTQGGSPRKRGDKSKEKAYLEWNARIEGFVSRNPSHDEKVQWVLSDKCGENHQQHIKIESLQPFASDTWICGEINCKGHVSEHSRRRLITMRLDKRGLCSYWVWGLCDMHNGENIFKEIKGKYSLDMDKMSPKRGSWQKTLTNFGGKYTHQMKDPTCVDGRDINHVYMMRPPLGK